MKNYKYSSTFEDFISNLYKQNISPFEPHIKSGTYFILLINVYFEKKCTGYLLRKFFSHLYWSFRPKVKIFQLDNGGGRIKCCIIINI